MSTLPLRGPAPDEKRSGRRLLRRAIVAVHFSPVMKIAEPSGAGIASFQDEVRHEYPDVALEFEQTVHFEITPDGVHQSKQELPVWRMFDLDKSWRLSLTRQTISLESLGPGYTNWTDFAERIQRLVQAVADHFQPAQVQRIGVRYVNAADLEKEEDPRLECTPELASITGHVDLINADLLWRFAVDEGTLILRSGVMMPNATYDPGAFDPPENRTWYLDIDVIKDVVAAFDKEDISRSLLGQVRRAHAIYCWALPTQSARQGSMIL